MYLTHFKTIYHYISNFKCGIQWSLYICVCVRHLQAITSQHSLQAAVCLKSSCTCCCSRRTRWRWASMPSNLELSSRHSAVSCWISWVKAWHVFIFWNVWKNWVSLWMACKTLQQENEEENVVVHLLSLSLHSLATLYQTRFWGTPS